MPESKPKILILIDCYLPGFMAGGPIRSVANIVKSLTDDFDFEIVTGNTDLKSDVPYATVPSDEWTTWDGTRVIYLSRANETPKRMAGLMRSSGADIVYLNSLFSVRYTLLPVLLIKLRRVKMQAVLAPRGMLGAGALQLKWLKKKVFLIVTRLTGLFNNVVWHASTPLEEEEIRLHYGKRARVVVARNIAIQNVDTSVSLPPKKPGDAKFFFLSRVAKKKNLIGAIRMMQKVAADRDVTFDIYGPIDEPDYWTECQTIIAQHPGVKIRYQRQVPPDELSTVIRGHHFFFLPTFNENYGHVIVESLVNGCPVIISDQTPWLDLQSKNVGWDVRLSDEAGFIEALTRCIEMDQAEFDHMSKAASEFGAEAMCPPEVLQKNRQLFREACRGSR